CAGFGDDALLAEPVCKQRLTDAVIDLVRAGVIQVFAFQPDLRAADVLRPALRVIDRRRTADIMLELVRELGAKFGVVAIARVLGLELVERADQRFGDENAAVLTEVAALVRQVIHVSRAGPSQATDSVPVGGSERSERGGRSHQSRRASASD